MMCPHCQIAFSQEHWGECPHCGRGVSGYVKTSTILISSENGGVFRSFDEIPEPLRKALVRSTNGANSATIVIADQAGRERLAEQMASRAQTRVLPPRTRLPNAIWMGIALAGFAAAAGWVLFSRIL